MCYSLIYIDENGNPDPKIGLPDDPAKWSEVIKDCLTDKEKQLPGTWEVWQFPEGNKIETISI